MVKTINSFTLSYVRMLSGATREMRGRNLQEGRKRKIQFQFFIFFGEKISFQRSRCKKQEVTNSKRDCYQFHLDTLRKFNSLIVC